MRRLFFMAVALLMVVALPAQAVSMNSIAPDPSLFGLSREAFQQKSGSGYSECKVGGNNALMASGIEVGSYSMDAYYIFEDDGRLSKITYLLNNSGALTAAELKEAYSNYWGEVGKELNKLDHNHNGEIDFEELFPYAK